MSHSRYMIRNYRPSDFEGYIKLKTTMHGVSPSSSRENLKRPNFSPEKDIFLAEIDGKIIGFMDVINEQKIKRVILDCLVHPEHRQRGLATNLLSYADQHAGELGAKAAHVNTGEANAIAGRVLHKFGFKTVRRFLELRLQLPEINLTDTTGDAYLCRQLKSGEENELALFQNRCFAGTWGYNPNTTGEIKYHLSLGRSSPDNVILVCDKDKPIAYCWTIIYHETGAASSEGKGRIHMIGVDPDLRGKKLGRTALQAGLSYLQTSRVKVVDLTVDSQNSIACGLYHATGFKTLASTLWYERKLG